MDNLLDPLGDRVMKNVAQIPRYPLTRDQLWHKSPLSSNREVPNIALLRKHLLSEGTLRKPEVLEIVN